MKRFILFIALASVAFAGPMFFGQNAASAAGPNAWFDSGTIAGDNAGKNNNPGLNYKPNGGISLTAGTATKARVRIRTYYGGGAVNVRMSLCNAAGTSIANGNASVSANGTTLEATFGTPVVITTGTYHLVVTGANSNIDFGYNNASGTIDESNVYGYTGSPGNVSTVSSTTTPATLLVGVFVQ